MAWVGFSPCDEPHGGGLCSLDCERLRQLSTGDWGAGWGEVGDEGDTGGEGVSKEGTGEESACVGALPRLAGQT